MRKLCSAEGVQPVRCSDSSLDNGGIPRGCSKAPMSGICASKAFIGDRLLIGSGAAAWDFGFGRGGTGGASPQRALTPVTIPRCGTQRQKPPCSSRYSDSGQRPTQPFHRERTHRSGYHRRTLGPCLQSKTAPLRIIRRALTYFGLRRPPRLKWLDRFFGIPGMQEQGRPTCRTA